MAQLRNCSIVHFILETDMAKKCRSSKLQFDSIFCILHCSFCISLELLSFHSFKVWKVLGLGFNAANRSSFHFPKSLFGDIVMICLWYIWGKFKCPRKLKLCPHWYPIRVLSWEGALLLMRKIFSICSPRKTRLHPWDHRLKIDPNHEVGRNHCVLSGWGDKSKPGKFFSFWWSFYETMH